MKHRLTKVKQQSALGKVEIRSLQGEGISNPLFLFIYGIDRGILMTFSSFSCPLNYKMPFKEKVYSNALHSDKHRCIRIPIERSNMPFLFRQVFRRGSFRGLVKGEVISRSCQDHHLSDCSPPVSMGYNSLPVKVSSTQRPSIFDILRGKLFTRPFIV